MRLAQRIQIGHRFERRRDHTILTVRQLHRADRVAEMTDHTGAKRCVHFRDLSRYYRPVT